MGTVKKKPTAKSSSQQVAPISADIKPQSKGPEKTEPSFNRDIAARAVKIWREKGCPKDCDVEIWLEAERQVTRKAVPPSHKDIAAQAVKIWREKGCPKGCDDQIWLEAERQMTGQQQQRFEQSEKDRTLPITDFSVNLMQELDELFPVPAGRGVITSL